MQSINTLGFVSLYTLPLLILIWHPAAGSMKIRRSNLPAYVQRSEEEISSAPEEEKSADGTPAVAQMKMIRRWSKAWLKIKQILD
jgi:hypothetical protein